MARSPWRRRRLGTWLWAAPAFGARLLGDGVEEGVNQPGLATVQALKAVQPDIGRTQFSRSLHPVAYPLQGGENLCEHPAVVGLVGFQDKGRSGWMGRGPLLRYIPEGYVTGVGPEVDHQRSSSGALYDDCGDVLQVGMVAHLDLGSKVGDE